MTEDVPTRIAEPGATDYLDISNFKDEHKYAMFKAAHIKIKQYLTKNNNNKNNNINSLSIINFFIIDIIILVFLNIIL